MRRNRLDKFDACWDCIAWKIRRLIRNRKEDDELYMKEEIAHVAHDDDYVVTDENKRKLKECVEIYKKKPIELDGLPESMRNNMLKSMERNKEAFEKLRKL